MVRKILHSIIALTKWVLGGTESSTNTRPPDTVRQSKKESDNCSDGKKYTEATTHTTQDVTTTNELSVTSEEAKEELKTLPAQHSVTVTQKTSPDVIEKQGNEQHSKPLLTTKDKKKIKAKMPREIGGKRGTRKQKAATQQSPKPRPELICRENLGSQQWEVILCADEEYQIKSVYQNGVSLDVINNECCLSSLNSPLQVVFASGEEYELSLLENKLLIFKLRNNWKGNGRKVSTIGRGHFVIIAPKEWERTGHVPVESSFCTDKNFKAHYFFRDTGNTNEDIGGFSQCALPTKSVFELNGKRVFDNFDCGELFVGDVPCLKSLQDIACVRVGEEKKGGWKGENFNPSERSIADILGTREGHFFIRVYDNKTRQLDSGEFRYLSGLKEILVNGQPYDKSMLLVPPQTGYLTIRVNFISKNNATLHPVLMSTTQHVKVQGSDLIVEPHPDGDCIFCRLETDTGSVDLSLNLPRIWWKITNSELDTWSDKPFVMTRQEFCKYADLNASTHIRLPRRFQSVYVGFNNELDRKYGHESDNEFISLHLKDFRDYSQIDQRLMEDARFNVKCGEEVLTLIRISADPIPTIVSFAGKPPSIYAGERTTLHWVTKNAETDSVAIKPDVGAVEASGSLEIYPDKTTTYKLLLTSAEMSDITKATTVMVFSMQEKRGGHTAYVKKSNGGWRLGRGFSISELRGAGLTAAKAISYSIRADKRRRTTHLNNIETLRRMTNAKRE